MACITSQVLSLHLIIFPFARPFDRGTSAMFIIFLLARYSGYYIEDTLHPLTSPQSVQNGKTGMLKFRTGLFLEKEESIWTMRCAVPGGKGVGFSSVFSSYISDNDLFGNYLTMDSCLPFLPDYP